jgi:hypothetical protein
MTHRHFFYTFSFTTFPYLRNMSGLLSQLSVVLGKTVFRLIEIMPMYYDTSLKSSRVDWSASFSPKRLSRIGNFFFLTRKRIFEKERDGRTGTCKDTEDTSMLVQIEEVMRAIRCGKKQDPNDTAPTDQISHRILKQTCPGGGGDMVIKDYVVLQNPQEQVNRLSPPRILDLTMTHTQGLDPKEVRDKIQTET